MKAGPEQVLAERYFDRFAKAGPAVGLEFGGVVEQAESRARSETGRRRDEGQKLRALLAGVPLLLLDERGRNASSEVFAASLAAMRDGGLKHAAIAIGGPDGHDPALREQARAVLSFGAATWPHQLVRILLAEQLYRAATIMAGHPYHRG